MGTSPGENRPRDTSANETPDQAPSKAAGNRLPPLPRSLRPLPVARPLAATPSVTPPPPGPTQTTAIAAPPPAPLTIAASTSRKANAEVTLIVTPLPPPVVRQEAARGRSPSPRVIVEPLAAELSAAAAPAAEAPAPAVPASEAPAPEARAAEARPAFSGAGNAMPARRLRIRTAALGGVALVAAILVIAIGFSSEDLPRARAATELDHLPPSDPGASPAPVPGPAADDPSGAAVEPAEPAVAAAADRTQQVAPSEAPPSTATPPSAPRPRPRSTAPSSQISATRDPGPARPAGRSRTRAVRPLTYDPNALFLNKR